MTKKNGLIIAGILMIGLMLGIFVIQKIRTDPDIIFFIPENNAKWIRYPEPFSLVARESREIEVLFRTRFDVATPPEMAALNLQAFREARVFLDNRLVFQSDPDDLWKKKYVFDLSGTDLLNAGSHELRIAVTSSKGYPALIAACEKLQIHSGTSWEASYDGKTWKPVLTVEKQPTVKLTRKFKRSDQAVRAKALVFLPVFLLVSILTYAGYRKKNSVFTAGNVRYALFILWGAMAANNIFKIPPYVGMDLPSHFEYIVYVMKNCRIPLPTEGWQMFQPPLYYIVSAVFAKILFVFLPGNIVGLMLRIIPLFCGIAQVEICYRSVRFVFPDREDLQCLGTIIGGLLPMNIYISQVVGNEPMAGFFSSMVVMLLLRYLHTAASNPKRDLVFVGIFLGLALLSKITACLLIPLFMLAIAINISPFDVSAFLKRVMITLGLVVVICGWYYLYSWIGAGKIVLRSANVEWWQDPGFRVWQYFFLFGESIFYPIYAMIISLWDSLYSTFWLDGSLSQIVSYTFRPPWNDDFLVSSALFSILPTTGIGIGMIASLRGFLSEQKSLFFCTCCVIVYICAILYVCLTLPVYSTAKATYMLGITPCFAVLCARGLDVLMVSAVIRPVIYGLIACWGTSVYLAYFV